MIALPTLPQIVQEPFFVWVTLNEHEWVILGERRGRIYRAGCGIAEILLPG